MLAVQVTDPSTAQATEPYSAARHGALRGTGRVAAESAGGSSNSDRASAPAERAGTDPTVVPVRAEQRQARRWIAQVPPYHGGGGHGYGYNPDLYGYSRYYAPVTASASATTCMTRTGSTPTTTLTTVAAAAITAGGGGSYGGGGGYSYRAFRDTGSLRLKIKPK